MKTASINNILANWIIPYPIPREVAHMHNYLARNTHRLWEV